MHININESNDKSSQHGLGIKLVDNWRYDSVLAQDSAFKDHVSNIYHHVTCWTLICIALFFFFSNLCTNFLNVSPSKEWVLAPPEFILYQWNHITVLVMKIMCQLSFLILRKRIQNLWIVSCATEVCMDW